MLDRFQARTSPLALWAGSGKSTLSTTIANSLREQGQLGAFVFFNRDVEERNQPGNVIRTLAHQFAQHDMHIAGAIALAIEATPDVTQWPLRKQFFKLLVEPLSTFSPSKGPLVLLLDALDECGSPQDRRDLLTILAEESVSLPSYIRIFITSRAEPDIRKVFINKPHILLHELDLASHHNINDIKLFVHHQMKDIRSLKGSLGLALDWPGDVAMHALVGRAAGLFVWATTACLFIEKGWDPRTRLDSLLRDDVNINAQTALDRLYTTALETSGCWDDEESCSYFRTIMGTILVARNPITGMTIDKLLSRYQPSICPSIALIEQLGCVLCGSQSEPVRILHPSFADFLKDLSRCGSKSWYSDAPLHNQSLTNCCIRQLDEELK